MKFTSVLYNVSTLYFLSQAEHFKYHLFKFFALSYIIFCQGGKADNMIWRMYFLGRHFKQSPSAIFVIMPAVLYTVKNYIA